MAKVAFIGASSTVFARNLSTTSRGVVRFVDEFVANLRRAGASGPLTVRADSGFWSRKLIDCLDAHDAKWSITVTLGSAVRTAIQAIPDDAWADIAYTKGGGVKGGYFVC